MVLRSEASTSVPVRAKRRFFARLRRPVCGGGVARLRALLVALPCLVVRLAAGDVAGAPLTRHYSFEEVGNVSRGALLGFDPLGRLTVTQDGAYAALNDGSWVDLADRSEGQDVFYRLAYSPDGSLYYGALGSWGRMERTPQGGWRAVALRPAECPAWVAATNFIEVVATPAATCFAGWNGVVRRDNAGGTHAFFAVPEVTCLFAMGDRAFVSSRRGGVQEIVAGCGELARPSPEAGGPVLVRTAPLPDGRIVAATAADALVVFDGRGFEPWAPQLATIWKHGVSDLQQLADGGVAVAVKGAGLYLLGADGTLAAAYDLPEYHAIAQLAANEPGILWAACESGIQRVAHGSAATVVDRRLGLPVEWPQVVRWRGRTIIASDGRLYGDVEGMPSAATRFQPLPHQPDGATWGLAAKGERLLVGNERGVFAVDAQGGFEPVLAGIAVARLVMVTPELCYAIGPQEIAVLRFEAGRWRECADRVPGLGYPSIVHAAGTAAWIELGVDRVARVALREGKLTAQLVERFPWSEKRWIEISVVGPTVVLRGTAAGRLYFDETKEAFAEAPQLDRLFAGAPYPLNRIARDSRGTLWASHERGVLRCEERAGGFKYSASALDLLQDHSLVVQVAEGDDIWWSNAGSLYHYEPKPVPAAARPLQPLLAEAVDARTGLRLAAALPGGDGIELPYAQNSLALRFFAGTYAIPSPIYEFRMRRNDARWTSLRGDSRLTLPELREGRYNLEVRLAGGRGAAGPPLALTFEIAPPWWRTGIVRVAEAVLGVGLLAALAVWFVRRQRARSEALERLVRERTGELKATMRKLNEETRNAAVLAERGRLAGEIHDSVQQGLSGLMLQVDATLRLAALPEEVRSRLNVARNMVSFTRQEVQQVVWDMESPLLADADLGGGIRRSPG